MAGNEVLHKIKAIIIKLSDFFYIPFRKLIPVETFRYAFCGGSNTAFDIILYFISYNFILDKQIVDFGIFAISPHIAAFILAFSVSFPTGFVLMKFIVFPDSYLRGRIQLMRYALTVSVCFLLNYIFIKIFVEYAGFYPTPSKILTTLIVITFSYFSQKYFSFKTSKEDVETDKESLTVKP